MSDDQSWLDKNIRSILALLSLLGCFGLIGYMAYTDKDDEGLKAFANSMVFAVLGYYFSANHVNKKEDTKDVRETEKPD
jgi:hypothetical protein